MRILLVCALALLPVQAAALSCLRPDVQRSYAEVDAAPESYVVVSGRLTFDPAALPRSHQKDTQPRTEVTAHLTGKSFGKDGFALPFERDIQMDVLCFGPWCGGVDTGAEVLAFIKRGAEGYTLEVSPCGGRVFANPMPKMLRQVEQCFAQGRCG